MLNMSNGSVVLRADLTQHDPNLGDGYVLAEWHGQFVTWHVWKFDVDNSWSAEAGNYFDTLDPALADYHERRGHTAPIGASDTRGVDWVRTSDRRIKARWGTPQPAFPEPGEQS